MTRADLALYGLIALLWSPFVVTLIVLLVAQ